MSDEAKQIEDGQRIAAFLADDAVKGALIELEKRYFAEFKAAATPIEREQLHARVRALDDLFGTMLGTVNSGKLVQHQRDIREAAEERLAKRNPRKAN